MGRVFRPEYTLRHPDGTTERRRTAWYHVEYLDATGRTRRRKAAPTHELAKEILRKRQEDVAKERQGIPTQNAGDLALEGLKDRYLASQKARVVRSTWRA
jgi:hypothetical protein